MTKKAMATTWISSLDSLKREMAGAASLDDVIAILRIEGAAEALAKRDEDEASISWIPTFSADSLGDGGEGWEIVSWDATRVVVLRYDDPDNASIEVAANTGR